MCLWPVLCAGHQQFGRCLRELGQRQVSHSVWHSGCSRVSPLCNLRSLLPHCLLQKPRGRQEQGTLFLARRCSCCQRLGGVRLRVCPLQRVQHSCFILGGQGGANWGSAEGLRGLRAWPEDPHSGSQAAEQERPQRGFGRPQRGRLVEPRGRSCPRCQVSQREAQTPLHEPVAVAPPVLRPSQLQLRV